VFQVSYVAVALIQSNIVVEQKCVAIVVVVIIIIIVIVIIIISL
jgi:hypothetical protein